MCQCCVQRIRDSKRAESSQSTVPGLAEALTCMVVTWSTAIAAAGCSCRSALSLSPLSVVWWVGGAWGEPRRGAGLCGRMVRC